MSNILKWIGAALVLAMGWFGDLPSIAKILLTVMTLDIIAGVFAAIATKNLSFQVAYNGVAKKAITLIIITAAYIVLTPVLGKQFSTPLGDMVASWYIFIELISIIEKADTLKVPIPQFLRNAVNNNDPDGPFISKG